MADRYRIHCLAADAGTLPDDVEIEASYPAFVVARVPDARLDALRSRFPLEKLGSAKPPPGVRAVAAVASAAQTAPARGPYTVVVRFDRPCSDQAGGCLGSVGAELVHPIGSRTLVARCANKEILARLEALDGVERVSHYVPTVRLSPGFFESPATDEDVARAMEVSDPGRKGEPVISGLVQALFLSGEERDRAARRLRRRSIRSIRAVGDRGLTIDLVAHDDRLTAVQEILALDGLERIEERRINRYFNDVARRIVGDRTLAAPPEGLGLDGAGEVIAIADSGLDTGDPETVHADFRGRVRDVQSFPVTPAYSGLVLQAGSDDGAADRFTGHGTHVAGSAVGNGTRSLAEGLDEPIRGTAPAAELVFQAIDQTMDWSPQGKIVWLQQFGSLPPSHGLFGIPDDLHDLFQPAYDQGARIHSNSWGGGRAGVYDDQCRALDEYVWNHRDFLVLVAAGNEGRDQQLAEGIDPTSIGSPAVAKNCLTVGASESERPERRESAGSFWPSKFPRGPFDEDPMADQRDDLAAFSSRGPCATGRRKPDLVAPGTFVLSARSSQMAANHFAWGSFPPAKRDYMFMGGTSMATPLVAGAAAVVRQFLRQEHGLETPSAALVKAALIHAAQYVPYRFAAPAAIPFADDEQGWGRLDLDRLLQPPEGEVVRFHDEDELPEGELFETEMEVGPGEGPLRVTLVYTDFPGEDLINNLNLFVLDPAGEFRVGNDFEGHRIPDGNNNVEGLVVTEPAAGIWKVRVVASAVPVGPQDFALVVSYSGDAPDTTSENAAGATEELGRR